MEVLCRVVVSDTVTDHQGLPTDILTSTLQGVMQEDTLHRTTEAYK